MAITPFAIKRQAKARRRGRGLACFTLSILISAVASADILLDKIIVEFPHDKPPRDDIYVINNGEENAFVKVEVMAWKPVGAV